MGAGHFVSWSYTRRRWSMQMNKWKIIYLNCRERYEFMIDHGQSPCPFGGGRGTFTDIFSLTPLVKPDFCFKLRYTLLFTRKV